MTITGGGFYNRCGGRKTVQSLSGTPEQLLRRSEWFVHLRWGAIFCTVAGAMVAKYLIGIHPPLREIFYLTIFMSAYNAVFLVLVRSASEVYAEQYHIRHLYVLPTSQIILDLVSLGCLIHLTGGAESPISLFLVFHMVIASILLPSRFAYLMCGLGVVLFGGIVGMEYRYPSLHRHMYGLYPVAGLELAHNAKFAFVILAVVCSSCIVTVYLANSIAREVWERDRVLTQAREQLRAKTEQLALANLRLQKIEERKSRFMRAAAHQLKAPLSAIVSMLKVLLGGFFRGGVEKQLETIERVEKRAEQLIDLVNDLLLLAKTREWQPSDVQTQPVALDSLVRTCAEMLRSEAEQKGLTLSLKIPPGRYQVLGDEKALRDIFTNLISNAVKYTPQGSVEVYIEERGAGIVCTVQDTGLGIPEDEIPHIFEEFYRASNVRTEIQEGTGLGLSIVKELVELHGGDIQVWSSPGQGTRFIVIFPSSEEARSREEETPAR